MTTVIVPQYIKSPDFFTDADTIASGKLKKYAKLLSVSFNDVEQTITPTSNIWSASTTYAADAEVYYMPKIGTRDEGIWKKYKSLVGSNVGNTPPEYGADEKWLDLGAIESYKAFDYYVNTTTSTATTDTVLKFKFQSQSVITSLALINTHAKTYKIKIWNNDSPPNLIVDGETINIYKPTTTYMDYFFSDFEYIRNVAVPEYNSLQLYSQLTIEITLTGISDIGVKCGFIVVGRLYDIGRMQYGASTGIKDFSKKIVDEDFGETYLKKGNYKDFADIDIKIKNRYKNIINSILRQLRATPTVIHANQNGSKFDDFLIFGFIPKFTVVHRGYEHSEIALEFEGLI